MQKHLYTGGIIAAVSTLFALVGGRLGMALAETQREGETWEDDWKVGLAGMRGGVLGVVAGLVAVVLVSQRSNQS